MKRESKNHRSRSSTENGGPPETIAFRLDAKAAETLAKKAEELGVSPHLLAKHCVLEKLSEPYSALHLMDELRKEFESLRLSHIVATQALLSSAGQVSSKEPKSPNRASPRKGGP